MGAAVAIAGLAIAAYGAKVQMDAADDMAEAQEDARNAQAAASAQRRMEERRASARRARIARARVLQASENSGVGGSSSAMGAVGSITTQQGAELQGIFQREDTDKRLSQANQDMADAQGQAQLGSSIQSVGGSIFSAGGGFGAFTSAPSIPQPPKANI